MRLRRVPCGSLGSSNRISLPGIAMVEDDKRQFEDATQSLYGAERELMVAMQNFVDAQA